MVAYVRLGPGDHFKHRKADHLEHQRMRPTIRFQLKVGWDGLG
jgi:hypothetical protein